MFNLQPFVQAIGDRRYTDASLLLRDVMHVLEAQEHLPVDQCINMPDLPTLSQQQLLLLLAQCLEDYLTASASSVTFPSYDALITWQVIISRVFYLGRGASADSVIDTLLAQNSSGIIVAKDIFKLYLLLGLETSKLATLQPLLMQNPELLLNTCLMHIWGCSGTEQSCANREWAYAQIPMLFEVLERPSLPLSKIHGFFMHCSYGFAANKHDLKKSLNALIRRNSDELALTEHPDASNPFAAAAQESTHTKPVILVILEAFSEDHSVYRVLGKSLHALKQKFTLVAVVWPDYVHISNDFFDRVITLSGTAENYCLQEVIDIAAAYQPVAVYYPSIGMTPWTIYFANCRLAPVQFNAIGHGASSFATEIDYFLIESDIAGDPHTYSEKVVPLPPGCMPFYPPNKVEYPKREQSALKPEVLNIVCSTSVMKLNYKLLQICQKVAEKYKKNTGAGTQNIAFHFFVMAHGHGMGAQSYEKLIKSYLPDAKIHLSINFHSYVYELSHMHLSLSTFPFSGMNTVTDFAFSGIPGVRMEGPQVHEAFDAGMWQRMNMPEWCIAKDEASYEAALYRMIDTPGLLQTLSAQLQNEQRWKVFFEGDSQAFVDTVERMIASHHVKLVT